MINLKTQLEIRYTPILDFSLVYKPIVSPYLKLSQFTVEAPGTFEEKIVIVFKSEKYQIDIRWDRMIFVSEGPRQDLRKTQGPLFIFFDIFKKLQSTNSFGVVHNCLLSEFNLKKGGGTNFNEVKENFKTKYLNSITSFFIEGFEDDCGVALEYWDSTKTKSFKVNYGPFQPEKDYINMKLLPISNTLSDDYKENQGLILDCLYFESVADVDMDLYKRFSNFILEKTNRISL